MVMEQEATYVCLCRNMQFVPDGWTEQGSIRLAGALRVL